LLKLARYLKKYGALLCIGVILLFAQAILDLNLPNMMSNIVNTGIQKSGIEEVAPKAISPDAFALLSLFMPERDYTTAQNAYTLYSELDTAQQKTTDKTFPRAAEVNALVYTATPQQAEQTDTVMGRAGYAFTDFLQTAAQQAGIEIGASDETSADFDLESLQQLMPLITNASQEDLDAAISKAADSPAMMTDSVAAVLNKAFYQALGADAGSMQTGYTVRIGLIMVLLSVANMACAIGAGYCFARLGAGVARDLRRDVFAKVSGFSNAEMDQFSTASLITRTTNDVTQVQTLYTMAMRMLVFAPLMGIGGVVMALR
jgi:ATP-binding cassette subfamily B protein